MVGYIRVSSQNLGGTILQSATEDVENVAGLQQGGRAKVDEFNVKLSVYDDVLIFNVSVQHTFLSQVTHG